METQASISQWAEETFGPVSSNFRVAARANEEMAELLRVISIGDSKKVAEEAADVAIVISRLASRLSIILDPSVVSPRDHQGARHLAAMANIKLATLLTYLALDDVSHLAGYTLQELWWYLEELCHELEYDLSRLIDEKMAINRKRQWERDGSGHGYHTSWPGQPLGSQQP